MKLILHLALLILGPFCILSCATDNREIHYRYKAFGTNRNVVVEGVINLRIDASNHVTGDWNLHAGPSQESAPTGPQIGQGQLTGHIEKNVVSIDLNPGMNDNNVGLHGTLSATNIVGEWGYYGFAGRMGHGKFEAVKSASNTKNP
jgi:hypothetical protein